MKYHIVRRAPSSAPQEGWSNPNPWLADFSPAGTPKSISFAQFVPPGSSNYRLHESSAPLPAGVTLDSANKLLVDDGEEGAISDVTGVLIEDYTPGGGGGDAAADWATRISGPGVVWYHAFESDAEVNAFRWTSDYGGGNDPNAVGNPRAGNVLRLAGAGPGGSDCLQITRPAGTTEVGSHWWRPFSPIVGTGNGRGQNDPGANGTITPQAYAATNGGSQIYGWGARGLYGHSSYHGSGSWDGTEYWLQMRVMMDPRRAQSGMPTVGKLTFQTMTYQSYLNQEIVTYSGGQHPAIPTQNNFAMYVGWNYTPLWDSAVGASGSTANRQPGKEGGACNPSANPNTCWAWSGGWDTVLYHVVPGRDGIDEQVIQVYGAHEGETTYTRIWDDVYTNHYDSGYPFGYNALICSSYNNGNNCPNEFWHRWAQIIFSKEFIPCPQV